MTKNNTNKKSSASRKLIPAIGMLTVSAMMLSSATYAWFTMSREVDVTGIQMTATVPENLEISLGKNMSTGTLAANATEGNQNGTDIAAPGDADWSNSVRVSDFYRFGYLLPASSTTGLNIFYTPDANGAGKSVEVDAAFTKANTAVGAGMTSYSIATANFASWNMEAQTKGYYIDIPVWFRTSKTGGVNLKVEANIINGATTYNETGGETGISEQLYKAARVSILGAASTANTTQKVLADKTYGGVAGASTQYYNRYTTSNSDLASALTFQAVNAAGGLGGSRATGNTAQTNPTNVSNIYGQTQFIQQGVLQEDNTYNGDTVVAVTAPEEGATWGAATEYTIRVWLEGEDVNCWDATAGQDFTIDLKFYRADAPKEATAANSP
jgi:hypothetical protein